MKLNITPRTKRKSGMTLLELTVVILVLLSLIAILFIGARAWKKGSDRAGCIMNIRNIQQAMRGDQNMKGRIAGDPGLLATNIIGVGGFIEIPPICPGDRAVYTGMASGNYPAVGTLWPICGNATGIIRAEHIPNEFAQW
jgi:type II secretory pathway pseudopilin PulG